MSKDTLEAITEEVRACTLCGLHKGRTLSVPGEGESSAKIMFIGEAPGFYEDKEGLPFVGASGRYLDELLRRIKLRRADVFITNVVRCRPPRNRDPLRAEVAACQAYTYRQIEVIKPKLIATLGRYSMAMFFGDTAKISHIHGQAKVDDGRVYFPLYHPAAALRSPALKPVMEDDFARMREIIDNFDDFIYENSTSDNNEPPPPEPPSKPEQLSLF